LGANELSAVELVGDHDLESVVKGINPADPREPRVHVADRQHKSSVDDNCEDQDTGERHGLRNCLCYCCHCSEDGCHNKGRHVGDQEEDEELRRLAAKTGHEVDDEVEAHCLCKLERNVDDYAGDCLV
jgi:hypothetical protein